MSKMFGPIHFWLYDQIRLVDGRTETLLGLLNEYVSEEDSSSVRKELDTKFGAGVGNFQLEHIVFPPAIHEGLSKLITRVESREAAAVVAFNDTAADLGKFYYEHGSAIGGQVKQGHPDLQDGPQGIVEVIQNIVLVGMPCDKVLSIASSDESSVVWRQSECLQAAHWEYGGADVERMFDLRGSWLAGLVSEINPDVKYETRFFRPLGNPASEEAIFI